ncbi:hypothetical protein KKF61_07750 [Patescibacteria group bacterium]|nr:hypothetical protein [Patescibacteria group bacterium]
MPSLLYRQLLKLTGGLRVTNSASLGAATRVEGDATVTASATFGGASDYMSFAASGATAPGRGTLAGKARVLKDVFLRPSDFRDAASSENQDILRSSCLLFDVSGSIFAGTAGSSLAVPMLAASANVTGSKYSAVAVFNVPTDADTTGCVIPIIEWTMHDLHANAGSSTAFYVGAAYLQGGMNVACAIRTAACVEYAASYNATASGELQSACMPAIPSFGANDKLMAVQVGWDPSSGSDASGSAAGILGLKLRYVSNAFGAQSPN